MTTYTTPAWVTGSGLPASRPAAPARRVHGASGRPVAVSFAGSWDNATPSRTSGRSGGGSGVIASSDAHRDSYVMRRLQANVQDAVRKHAIMRTVAGSLLRMTVGPEPDVVFKSSSDSFNAAARAWFDKARESRRFERRRMNTLGEVAEITLMAAMDAGRIAWLKTDDGSVQAIESPRIVNPSGAWSSHHPEWRDGVRIDRDGRPLGFNVAEWNRTGTGVALTGGREIDAWAVLYMLNPLLPEPNATTREPALLPAIEWSDSLSFMYSAINAALNRAASVGMVWNHPDPEAYKAGVEAVLGLGEAAAEGDGEAATAETVETPYGIDYYGPEGLTGSQIKSEHPNPNLDWYVVSQLRIIAASLGLPLEAVIYLFNQSYTAHRAAFACAWPAIEKLQGWLEYGLLRHVVRHAMAADIRSGRLVAPGGVPTDWGAMELVLPPMPIFDPVAEVEAADRRVQGNYSTKEVETRRLTGMDWREVAARRAVEKDIEWDLGIEPPQTPGSQVGTQGQSGEGTKAGEERGGAA